jgi:hypothetical protein
MVSDGLRCRVLGWVSMLVVCGPLACGADTSGPAGRDARSPLLPVSGSVLVTIPGSGASCAAISQRAQSRRAAADIIIAVDNSGSMSEEIGFVREQLQAFSQAVAADGVDVRIILISAPRTPPDVDDDDDERDSDDASDEDDDNGICLAPPLGSGSCPLDSRGLGYLHVPQAVKSHDALNQFIDTFARWRDQLRPEASKTFIVVSDDDAQSAANDSALAFQRSVADLPGGLFARWSFSGIYCFSRCPASAAVGSVYAQLVQDTRGVAGDLCQQNFTPVFAALADAVVAGAGLDCAWDIPAPPIGQTFVRDQVNVQYTTRNGSQVPFLQFRSAAACGTESGWYYDDALRPSRIIACPVACAALQNDRQASIDVLFGCDTQFAPD